MLLTGFRGAVACLDINLTAVHSESSSTCFYGRASATTMIHVHLQKMRNTSTNLVKILFMEV